MVARCTKIQNARVFAGAKITWSKVFSFFVVAAHAFTELQLPTIK